MACERHVAIAAPAMPQCSFDTSAMSPTLGLGLGLGLGLRLGFGLGLGLGFGLGLGLGIGLDERNVAHQVEQPAISPLYLPHIPPISPHQVEQPAGNNRDQRRHLVRVRARARVRVRVRVRARARVRVRV